MTDPRPEDDLQGEIAERATAGEEGGAASKTRATEASDRKH